MGAISSGNLDLLRSRPDTQYTKESLYSFGFPTMWTGRVNDSSITRGERSIVYDTGALESGFVFGDIVAGLEVWFGSSAGGKDLGRRRLRSISGVEASGTMVVDWYDDISLSDDDFITIVHMFAPWPKYSYFTAAGPTFRKDGPDGDTYTDENEDADPLVIMGRNYANELPSAGSLVVQLDAASSQAVANGASISTYLWDVVPSGPTISDTGSATPTITFTGEGRWWVSCTGTDDNGNSSTGYRAYRIGGGITEFSRNAIVSRFDDVEVTLGFTITSPSVTWADFDDRSLIILTAEDYYGSTQSTISFRDTAVYTDHHHIMFSGYLTLENQDLADDGTGKFQMTAVSTLPLFLYSLSLTGEHSPTDWYEMHYTLMTVAGNLFHLFKYHSTLLDIMDWWLPWSDTTKRSGNELFAEGNILEKARALIRSRLMAMTATPQGEIYVEADLNLQDSSTRSAETTTLTLTTDDISGVKRVRARRWGDTIRVLLSGGSSTGLLGTFVPYLSASHDVARAEGRPSIPSYDTLMLATQTEANNFAGRLAQVANARYQEINLDFAGNYREVFSPADQQWTNLGTIIGSSDTANLRAFTDLESAKCVPRQVTVNPPQNGFSMVNVIFEVEAPEGLGGVTLPTPSVPSTDIGDSDYDPPDPPAWPIPEPETTLPFTLTGTLYSFDDTNGCYYRKPDDSDWTVRNGSLSGTDINDDQGGSDPWWQVKTASSNVEVSILWKCTGSKIFRSADGGTSWVEMTPVEDPPNDWGDSPAPEISDLTFIQRADNIHNQDEHYFLARATVGGGERGWLLKTADDGITWTWKSLGTDISDDDYYYATRAEFHCSDAGGAYWSANSDSNATGSADDATAYFERVGSDPGGCETSFHWWVDLGVPMTEITIEVRSKGDPPDLGALQTFISNDPADYGSLMSGPQAITGSGDWYETDATLTWNSPGTAKAADGKAGPYQYIEFRMTNGGQMRSVGEKIEIDAVRVTATVTKPETQPIWMDIDVETGSFIWLTVWTDADELFLQKRNTSDLELVENYSLGSCTSGELDALTYVAFPMTPAFDQDVCYVFGRMNAPQGLANPEHLIETLDGGTSFSSIENGFAADYIGALQAWASGANWQIICVRNVVAGSAGQFYSGLNTGSLSLQGATTFQVNQDALTVKGSSYAIGAIAAVGGEAVNVSTDGGATWADITDSHPAGSSGEIKSLVYV